MARIHKDWLKAYMEYTKSSESPTAFHFWTGVATIAGALRRRVWTDHKLFKWTPNFYIVLVGPAGIATKSTSMLQGMKLLEQVPGVFFGPSSTTWQALTKAMETAHEEIEYENEWSEIEKLPMSCITLALSELGTFMKLASEGFAEVLIDMWDGQESIRPWQHTTITNPEITIANPWLNLIGCTTPAWIKGNFPEYQIGGGLTSRMIFVYGDQKRQLVAYPERSWQGRQFETLKQELIHDLTEISQMLGRYRLTEAAYEWGTAWYERHWRSRPAHMASDRYEGYIARKQTHLHKLAMVLAASQRSDLVLHAEDLQKADSILTDAEHDMIQVFESIGVVHQARQVNELKGYVKAFGQLTANELWTKCMNIMSYEDFLAALKAAIEGGVFLVIETGRQTPEGKPEKAVRLSHETEH